MLWALKKVGVKGDRYSIMKDYLKGRWVEMSCGSWSIGKRVNRSCPQGSVLSPQIWKLVFDEFIREVVGERL